MMVFLIYSLWLCNSNVTQSVINLHARLITSHTVAKGLYMKYVTIQI